MRAPGLTDEQTQKAALVFARGRSLLGLGLTLVPGTATKIGVGKSSGPASALMRMVGVRDLAIGLGAVAGVRGGPRHRSGWAGVRSPTAWTRSRCCSLRGSRSGRASSASSRPAVPSRG